ncbi:MAG: DHHA1 domain-containing protein [Candidatus Methanofastidiosia archaeon]
MLSKIKEAVELLDAHKNDEICIVSHIDADGISSASILSKALERRGIEHEILFVKLDEIKNITPSTLTIFSDLGSGQLHLLSKFKREEFIILDHHPPENISFENLYHINPYLFGFNGSEISGSGVSYLFARKLSEENVNLSGLAIVGACGDQQNFGALSGLNREILMEGVKERIISYERDLLLYGRCTRPIHKSLQYFSDPYVPGVSGTEEGSIRLLKDLKIELRNEDWRTLSDLSFNEKKNLASALIERILSHVPSEFATHIPKFLIGETYTLLNEEERSPLRDSNEFATCFNACGRNQKPEVALEVGKGNRGIYFEVLLGLLRRYRKVLAEAIEVALKRGVERRDCLQVLDGTGIQDNMIGPICSMILGENGIDPYLPILGYTTSESDRKTLKISARCSKLLLLKGINLGKAMRRAASLADGEGGGHAPACGAYVRRERFEIFLNYFESLLKRQQRRGRLRLNSKG